MPTYIFNFYQYDDITGTGSTLSTTSTTGATGNFTVNNGASPLTIEVDDDDDFFEDAFIETGGSQTLAADLTVNGVTYLASNNPVVELEFAVDTTTGETFLYIRIDGVNVGIGGLTLPTPGTTYTISASSDGQSRPFDDLACFTAGTLIDTNTGQRPVETLRPGDQIRVHGGGFATLKWTGHRRLSAAELAEKPFLAPILISAGALGNARELQVSPQHRMLVSDWRAQLYFGEDQVLIPAKALLNGHNVRLAPAGQGVCYTHLLFERHEVIFSEGAASESFFPGQHGLNGLNRAAQCELSHLFPELVAEPEAYGKLAFPAPNCHLAQSINWAEAA